MHSDPATPSKPAATAFFRDLEGISDTVRLATVNAVAAFHSNAVWPRRNGLPTSGMADAARSTCMDATISATRPAVPNIQFMERPAFPL